jgi:hypothetical protein
MYDRIAAALRRSSDSGDVVGLDTEFWGVEIGKQSCASRARVHLISLAIKRRPHTLAARPYHIADTVVVLSSALSHEGIFNWIESDAPKAVHNLPVDAHALATDNCNLGGGINTLSKARWAWPGRARGPGFTLDSLGEDLIGAGKTESYQDIFTEIRNEVIRTRIIRTRHCKCEEPGCRRRKLPDHEKFTTETPNEVRKDVPHPVPLQSVIPGHPLWKRAEDYSARDAWLALAVDDLANYTMHRTERSIPW